MLQARVDIAQPIGVKFFWLMPYCRIQVVHYHDHNRSRLSAFCWVGIDWVRSHFDIRSEAIHVDMSVRFQLVPKFLSQCFVMLWFKISFLLVVCCARTEEHF
jgi:hypothetical protein